jgi:hypothetical protein
MDSMDKAGRTDVREVRVAFSNLLHAVRGVSHRIGKTGGVEVHHVPRHSNAWWKPPVVTPSPTCCPSEMPLALDSVNPVG